MAITTLEIEEAANIFGGMAKLASILGITRSTLYAWQKEECYYIDWCHEDFEHGAFINHLVVMKEVMYAGIPDVREKRSGHVYCVCNGEHMKIGRSKSPKERVKTIRESMIRGKARVYISPLVSDAVSLELAALNHFKETCIYGEVFTSNFSEAVDFIKGNIMPTNTGVRKKAPSADFIFDGLRDSFNKKSEAVQCTTTNSI